MMTQYQPLARALIIAVVEGGKLVDYYALRISTASREARDFLRRMEHYPGKPRGSSEPWTPLR